MPRRRPSSKEKEQFGKGSIDGLMAAETGDMASIPGHIIPALALGIPGSAPSAVLMAAMIIHGIQPGPMMMIQHPQFIYDVVAMTSLATVSILIFGLFLIKPLLLVLRIKRTVLMPIIFLLCTVGAFASASRLFDIYCMLAIGIGAFFLRRRGYQMAPFVLGLVLGGLLDKSLRRGLVLSDGSIDAVLHPADLSIGFATVDDPHPAALHARRSRSRCNASPAASASSSGRLTSGASLHNRVTPHADRPVQRGARRHAARGAMPRSRRSSATTASRSRPFTLRRVAGDIIDARETAPVCVASSRRRASSSPACTGCWSSRPACR